MTEEKALAEYRLLKQIGQGSMGTVFVAEHRFTKKNHIIKVLPEELASDRGFMRRFEEEISLVAGFDHPNIVKIHTVCFAQGTYFLVSDCIVDNVGETCNLHHYFGAMKKVLPEEEILSISTQIADAIDYGHSSRNSFHGGIKLNNILIGNKTPEGYPHVFLSDWGLSRIIGTGFCLNRTYKGILEGLETVHTEQQRSSSLYQTLTQNFSFLAPEQKRPPIQATKAVDLYAFGVLVYYLLMAEYPEGYFPLPSTKYKNPLVNWDLLIAKCLAFNHEDRPQKIRPILKEVENSTMRSRHIPIIERPLEEEHCTLEKKHCPDIIRKEPPVQYTPELNTPIIHTPQKAPSEEFKIEPQKNSIPAYIEPLLSDMVTIDAGTYLRGSNNGCRDEMPAHKIILTPFGIDIHPVTNEQFIRFLQTVGDVKDAQHNDIIRLKESRIKKSTGKFLIEPGYTKHPVVGVTWYGAIAYCQWAGKRLPTEAEWEIASLGGLETTVYPVGDTIEKNQANFFSADTTAVMSYPPNGYGIYDMAGNVYEWCHDWYEYAYYQASMQEPEQPKGPIQGVYRVLRGGCWKSLQEDLRVSKRHRNKPSAANGTYGFRCAKNM